jgi:hypothetical protein
VENAHVHPVLAGVLDSFAALPQRVAAATLVRCRVSVTTEAGAQTYDGWFPSTCDAVLDAHMRMPMPMPMHTPMPMPTSLGLRMLPCKVSAKVQPQ